MNSFKRHSLVASVALATTVVTTSFTSTAFAAESESLEAALLNGKATLDLRYRYEAVDQDGADKDAKASTVKTRLNYATGTFKGVSGFIEFDDVTSIGDVKYNDAAATPESKTEYPVVADPQGTEVNQAYLKYSGIPDTTVTFGRQRVILDNARFIGNVGWRQNEQTYDALTLVNKSLPDTTIVYGYVTNVNRIFGEASDKGDVDTKTHLLNISYAGLPFGKLSAYGYFLDFVDTPDNSNSTLGLRFAGNTAMSDDVKLLYTLELAQQSDYKDGADTIDYDYSMIELGATVSGVTAKIGQETLGSNDGDGAFFTPLATAHAFNGWADKFLATPANGLVDTFVSVGTKVGGVKLLAVYHDYTSDEENIDYGTELDLLVAKKINKKYTLLGKYASYSADDHATDTDKLWLMAQATFK